MFTRALHRVESDLPLPSEAPHTRRARPEHHPCDPRRAAHGGFGRHGRQRARWQGCARGFRHRSRCSNRNRGDLHPRRRRRARRGRWSHHGCASAKLGQERGDVFSGLTENGHGLTELRDRALRHETREQGTAIEAAKLHRGFVGLNLGEEIVDGDGLALGLQPADEGALFHGGRELGKFDDACHGSPGRSVGKGGACAAQDSVFRGDGELLEVLVVGHRSVPASDPQHWRTELCEALALYPIDHLGPHTAEGP